MNTVERIVESYYRLVQRCFTMPDVKVAKGNNRQLDLLAYSLLDGTQYHIESSVTHRLNWCPTAKRLSDKFEHKFFGAVHRKESDKSDYAKGKSYYSRILETYESVGFDPERVVRVWVCWTVKDPANLEDAIQAMLASKKLPPSRLQVVSFRDRILPELQAAVRTANYDDDVLRTLSLLHQRGQQTADLVLAEEGEQIPNEELTLDDVPAPGADWDAVGEFALTFDGYAAMGSLDACAELTNRRSPSTLAELRACLFFEQRRYRHSDAMPEGDDWHYIQSLVKQIADSVRAGQLD